MLLIAIYIVEAISHGVYPILDTGLSLRFEMTKTAFHNSRKYIISLFKNKIMALKNILQRILQIFTTASALLILNASAVFAADEWGMGPPPPGVPGSFDTAVMNATNWLLGFVGMIGVLMIIWGGINYIGSAGNEDTARTAKKTITYGIIGVVIAGFAYAIVNVIVTTILT